MKRTEHLIGESIVNPPAAVIDEHVIDVPVIDESIVNPPAAMAIEHQAGVTIEHVSVDDSQSTETVSFDNSKSLENQENLLNNYTD